MTRIYSTGLWEKWRAVEDVGPYGVLRILMGQGYIPLGLREKWRAVEDVGPYGIPTILQKQRLITQFYSPLPGSFLRRVF